MLESPIRGEDIDFKFKFKKELQIILTFLPEGFMPKSSGKTRIFTEKEKKKNKDVYHVKKYGSGSYLICSSFVSFPAGEIKDGFCKT